MINNPYRLSKDLGKLEASQLYGEASGLYQSNGNKPKEFYIGLNLNTQLLSVPATI